jgi:hypothetical protein
MIERILLRTALRDLFTVRRAAIAALLILGPACVGGVVRIGTRSDFDGVATYGALASLLVFGFVLPILAVVFGTGAISQEMEQRTIVYLLTRPVARWRILLIKYLAAWLAISLTGILAMLVLAGATYQPSGHQGGAYLRYGSVKDARQLCARLQTPETPLLDHLRNQLSGRTRDALDRWDPQNRPGRRLVRAVVTDLNAVIGSRRSLYDEQLFAGVTVPDDARQLIAERAAGPDLARLNRWLIEAALPGVLYPSRSPAGQVWRDVVVLPVGAAAYGAFFLLLATLFHRALIGGLFLAFGWESWVPMLPGNFKLLSVMTYLRALAPHVRPQAESTDMLELFQVLNPDTVPASLAWTVLAATTLAALALALVVFSVREYVPKDDSA